MTRFLFLLLLCPFVGCQQASVPVQTPLKPVVVDEAAAYPAQELGTRPPILIGFAPLTKEQLDDGWVQLFDGVSTFGWVVSEGEGTLSVMTDGTKNFFVFDKTGQEEQAIIAHRFCVSTMECKSDGTCTCVATTGWETHWDSTWNLNFTIDLKSGSLKELPRDTTWFTFNGLRGKPHPRNLQSLTESDWKPAAGASKSTWTDGVLELTGGSGMVESVEEYGDFILQLEYFTEKGINSGVFFRCIPGETMNGYECQILNTPSDNDYNSFIGTDTGGIFRRQVGRNVGPKDGEWNYLTIAARGPDIATWVNGIQVTDWTDTRDEHNNPRNGKRLQPGTIQLQGHDPGTKIMFRNFRIAEWNP
ncbi:MAG: DUF1080 domain-containing protein [Planctomycetaceae bacterium]|nr:DUF1080 domain-containing protein [Planctomycetaceae bacterium]